MRVRGGELEKRVVEADREAAKIKEAPVPAAPSQARLDQLKSELSEMEEAYTSLGFFKRKEKESMASSIAEKKRSIEAVANAVQGEAREIEGKHAEEMRKALAGNDSKYAGARSRLGEVEGKLAGLRERLAVPTA